MNITNTVKKLMGWCPQHDFEFMQTRDTKHRTGTHDFCAGYGDTQKNRQDKMLVDVPFLDSGMARIFLPVWIAGLMLMLIVNRYSILDFFIILSYYLAFLLLVLQNRTTVELTHGTIIIHRPFLRSIVIQKNEVIKTQVVKNFDHTMRWIIQPVALIVLILLAIRNINAIYINIGQSFAMLITMVNIFSIPLLTVMFAVLFYNFEIRTHYMATLNVSTDKRQFMFYVDNPDDFSAMLQHTGEVTLDG